MFKNVINHKYFLLFLLLIFVLFDFQLARYGKYFLGVTSLSDLAVVAILFYLPLIVSLLALFTKKIRVFVIVCNIIFWLVVGLKSLIK